MDDNTIGNIFTTETISGIITSNSRNLICNKIRGIYMDIYIKSNGFDSLYVQASGRLDLDSAVEYGTKVKDAI